MNILDSSFQTHGEAKLDSMKECKDFKRGIRLLEWYAVTFATSACAH